VIYATCLELAPPCDGGVGRLRAQVAESFVFLDVSESTAEYLPAVNEHSLVFKPQKEGPFIGLYEGRLTPE
jgi:hypothetical protein